MTMDVEFCGTPAPGIGPRPGILPGGCYGPVLGPIVLGPILVRR
jgi:hypothetical protein